MSGTLGTGVLGVDLLGYEGIPVLVEKIALMRTESEEPFAVSREEGADSIALLRTQEDW